MKACFSAGEAKLRLSTPMPPLRMMSSRMALSLESTCGFCLSRSSVVRLWSRKAAYSIFSPRSALRITSTALFTSVSMASNRVGFSCSSCVQYSTKGRFSADILAGRPKSISFTPAASSATSRSYFTASSDGAFPPCITMPSRARRCWWPVALATWRTSSCT